MNQLGQPTMQAGEPPFKRFIKPILILVIIAVVAGIVTLVVPKLEKHAPVESEATGPMELDCVHVEKMRLSRVDQFPGEIQAYQDVAIYPKVPGFIKWIGVDRGSDVKKGYKMIGMFAPELIAQRNEANSKAQAVEGQLHEAESRLFTAKARVLEARAKMLGDNDTYQRTKSASAVPGVVAPNQVVVLEETVKADRDSMKAWEDNVKAAENQVNSLKNAEKAARRATDNYRDIADYLLITAPFDGHITERNMHVGSFCGPLGSGAYPPIVRIQQLNLLRIITPVPEVDTGGVKPGAKVEFTVSTYPSERFVGTVARIGDYLDQKTRTMPVELNYWNKDRRILPGMFCEIYWPTERKYPTLFVPASAVESTSTLETFVCRLREGKIEWVPVKKGLMMNGRIEVFGDLAEGDIVALHGSDSLKQGMEVNPKFVPQEEASQPESPRPVYHTVSPPFTVLDSERRGEYTEGDKAEPGPAAGPETKSKPESGAKPEPGAKPESGAQAERKSKPQSESKPESQ